MLDFFAAALGLLDPRLSKTLQICSELSFLRCVQTSYLFGLVFVCIFFYSYDTEALNKKIGHTCPDEDDFINTFRTTGHKKITQGVQQLYLIGLYINERCSNIYISIL